MSAGASNADVCHDDGKTVTNQSTSQDEDKTKDAEEEVTDEEGTHKATADHCATAQRQSQSTSTVAAPTQDAKASMKEKSSKDLTQTWTSSIVNAGHDLLWPSGVTPTTGPTLLIGVKMSDSDHLIAHLMEWERKFESADLEKHKRFLQDNQLSAHDHPLEAMAWENGFVPEAEGLPSDQLEFRIQRLMPPLAYMASRPRQPTDVGEELLRRFDAGVRPYWLRDWQSGFGGYTKVCEYQVDGVTKRQFSVAHVVRPRTKSSNACLCFTLLSKMPSQKPWNRPAGTSDPSRGIILGLQENCNWKMPSTVILHSNSVAVSLEDHMQVQCLLVFGSDRPRWTYRKLPKVTEFRSFDRLPLWCRRPQKMTYHLCAEDTTKNAIVPSLPDEEREELLVRGILPRESSARVSIDTA